MIETPAAVMMAGELLNEVDFLNIGSNDLLYYSLAASRENIRVEKRYHVLHLAIVKLLQVVIKAGKRCKKEVCLCGEITSFEKFYPLLLQMGIHSFSVPISSYADIRCQVYRLLFHNYKGADKKIVTRFFKIKSKNKAEEYFNEFT